MSEEPLFFLWRSRRTFIDAWYIPENWEEGDLANVIDERDLPRRNSCPGFVTLWEQTSGAATSTRKQRRKPKINNQRKRQAAKKLIKWEKDSEICPTCCRLFWRGGPGNTEKPDYYICTKCKTKRHSSSSYYCAYCDIDVCIGCAKK